MEYNSSWLTVASYPSTLLARAHMVHSMSFALEKIGCVSVVRHDSLSKNCVPGGCK